jgi:hypothetical protein
MIEMETVAMSRMKVGAESKLHPNYPFPVAALSIKHSLKKKCAKVYSIM